ncbi:hypothetical protein EMMF5_004345 [Cystobasidiomycetes sp. EMM_F5]
MASQSRPTPSLPRGGRSYYGSAIIPAAAEEVWRTITDAATYASWNQYTPAIDAPEGKEAAGTLIPGSMSTLHYRMDLSESPKPMLIRISMNDPAQMKLCWQGLPKGVPLAMLESEKVQQITVLEDNDGVAQCRYEIWETQVIPQERAAGPSGSRIAPFAVTETIRTGISLDVAMDTMTNSETDGGAAREVHTDETSETHTTEADMMMDLVVTRHEVSLIFPCSMHSGLTDDSIVDGRSRRDDLGRRDDRGGDRARQNGERRNYDPRRGDVRQENGRHDRDRQASGSSRNDDSRRENKYHKDDRHEDTLRQPAGVDRSASRPSIPEAGVNTKRHEVEREDDEDEQDDTEAAMAAMMGFGGFGTTKNTHVASNDDVGTADLKQPRVFRQYMNRPGGFNRPLDKIK